MSVSLLTFEDSVKCQKIKHLLEVKYSICKFCLRFLAFLDSLTALNSSSTLGSQPFTSIFFTLMSTIQPYYEDNIQLNYLTITIFSLLKWALSMNNILTLCVHTLSTSPMTWAILLLALLCLQVILITMSMSMMFY
jgi:hypothetical protein